MKAEQVWIHCLVKFRFRSTPADGDSENMAKYEVHCFIDNSGRATPDPEGVAKRGPPAGFTVTMAGFTDGTCLWHSPEDGEM